jgi:hypothetical protein
MDRHRHSIYFETHTVYGEYGDTDIVYTYRHEEPKTWQLLGGTDIAIQTLHVDIEIVE